MSSVHLLWRRTLVSTSTWDIRCSTEQQRSSEQATDHRQLSSRADPPLAAPPAARRRDQNVGGQPTHWRATARCASRAGRRGSPGVQLIWMLRNTRSGAASCSEAAVGSHPPSGPPGLPSGLNRYCSVGRAGVVHVAHGGDGLGLAFPRYLKLAKPSPCATAMGGGCPPFLQEQAGRFSTSTSDRRASRSARCWLVVKRGQCSRRDDVRPARRTSGSRCTPRAKVSGAPEEALELRGQHRVEGDGTRPADARAQRVAIAEAAAGHHAEVRQRARPLCRSVMCTSKAVEARLGEGVGHFDVRVDALLAQHGDPGPSTADNYVLGLASGMLRRAGQFLFEFNGQARAGRDRRARRRRRVRRRRRPGCRAAGRSSSSRCPRPGAGRAGWRKTLLVSRQTCSFPLPRPWDEPAGRVLPMTWLQPLRRCRARSVCMTALRSAAHLQHHAQFPRLNRASSVRRRAGPPTCRPSSWRRPCPCGCRRCRRPLSSMSTFSATPTWPANAISATQAEQAAVAAVVVGEDFPFARSALTAPPGASEVLRVVQVGRLVAGWPKHLRQDAAAQRWRPGPGPSSIRVVSAGARVELGVSVPRTSASVAKALTIRLTGEVTFFCCPSSGSTACAWTGCPLPTGMLMPSAGTAPCPRP